MPTFLEKNQFFNENYCKLNFVIIIRILHWVSMF